MVGTEKMLHLPVNVIGLNTNGCTVVLSTFNPFIDDVRPLLAVLERSFEPSMYNKARPSFAVSVFWTTTLNV